MSTAPSLAPVQGTVTVTDLAGKETQHPFVGDLTFLGEQLSVILYKDDAGRIMIIITALRAHSEIFSPAPPVDWANALPVAVLLDPTVATCEFKDPVQRHTLPNVQTWACGLSVYVNPQAHLVIQDLLGQQSMNRTLFDLALDWANTRKVHVEIGVAASTP